MALVRRDLTRDFAELRQKSAAPALAAASVSPQWLMTERTLSLELLRGARSHIGELKVLHEKRARQTSDGDTTLDRAIVAKTQTILKALSRCKDALNAISHKAKFLPTAAEVTLALNVRQSLVLEVQEVARQLSVAQTAFNDRLSSRRFTETSFAMPDEDDVDDDETLALTFRSGFSQEQALRVQTNRRMIEERDQALATLTTVFSASRSSQFLFDAYYALTPSCHLCLCCYLLIFAGAFRTRLLPVSLSGWWSSAS
eukprot:m.448135 g.448135  ORF g.448135 m.448135 type:complete len:257 (-) comp56889_c0_seq11:155-925(-)